MVLICMYGTTLKIQNFVCTACQITHFSEELDLNAFISTFTLNETCYTWAYKGIIVTLIRSSVLVITH